MVCLKEELCKLKNNDHYIVYRKEVKQAEGRNGVHKEMVVILMGVRAFKEDPKA